MNGIRSLILAAALGLVFFPLSSLCAEAPSVTMKATSIGVGVGSSRGSGILTYKGQKIPFRIEGLSFGEVGISQMTTEGEVKNLNFLEAFDGCYTTTKAEGAVLKGKGISRLRNEAGVEIVLTTNQTGLMLSASIGCTEMELDRAALAKALVELRSPPIRADYQSSIFFDSDSYEIRIDEMKKLEQIVALLEKTPSTNVIVTGFTDTTGAEKHNQKLSEQRARAVFEELKKRAEGTAVLNVPPNRVQARGRGEAEGPDNTEAQGDRRVDILIIPSAKKG